MSYETATPYIASYVLIEKLGKVAFVLRTNTPWMNGYFGLPSGKVEKGESYQECAVREAEEEAGIKVSKDKLEFVHTAHRRHEGAEDGNWVDVYFRAKQWEGKPYNAEPKSHSELVWLDPANLPSNVIPSTKHAIDQIRKDKPYSEYGFN